MNDILSYVTIITGVLMTITILLQQRGASLGAGFGASGEFYTTRRGIDKSLFDTTIVLAVLFVGSLVVGLVVI
ncbi:MAG TPA: preprotein translocase subunit SecG [Candidatus Saccharimonadales bacterium]|nr:preprotein translocase subunit SecG [Candidatus Saccharimonadales bacterium]